MGALTFREQLTITIINPAVIGLLLLAACLVVMLADLLAAADLASEEELDRLTALFSDRLREAVSRRDGPVGHA